MRPILGVITAAYLMVIAAPAAMAANDERRNPTAIDAQIKCAAQAELFFQKWKRAQIVQISSLEPSMVSHYNTKLNRCIVNIDGMYYGPTHNTRSEYLIDAIEGVGFGWIFTSTPKMGGNTVVNSCDLLSPSNSDLQCPEGFEEEGFTAYRDNLMKE